MKRILMAVAAVAVVAMAGSAMAAGQTSINVSARVVGTCKFNSASSTLSLGDLPFNAATGAPSGTSAAGFTTFWCTNNATFSITDDDGMHESGANANRLQGVATGEWIDYSFTYTPTSGLGLGPTTNIVLDYTATVGPTYANNSADTYNDTVVLTINP
jgi:spore coat protein U-like protein